MAAILNFVDLNVTAPYNCQVSAYLRLLSHACLLTGHDPKVLITFELVRMLTNVVQSPNERMRNILFSRFIDLRLFRLYHSIAINSTSYVCPFLLFLFLFVYLWHSHRLLASPFGTDTGLLG